MKNAISLKGLTYVVVAFVMFLSSCKDNNSIDFTANDATNIEGESTSDAFISDATDVSTDAVNGYSDAQLNGGRTDEASGFGDNDRLKCATVTVVKSDNSTDGRPAGVITIVFPADGSCKDARGNVRKGTITITYAGRKFLPNSTMVTTFTNYTINGIKIEGTHTITNVSASTADFPKFTVVIAGGKVTFLNGQTITREQTFTREWQRATNPAQDKWVLLAGSRAAGTTRNGKDYVMEVTKDVVHSRACQISNKTFIAVSGEKKFTTENKQIIVNFGEGTCDNVITVTVNGKSREVTVNGDGN
ncbi:hypothetical protein BH09BAC3_BH09BAC3_23440 [soil metagenome]